jgi:hypothetical protein
MEEGLKKKEIYSICGNFPPLKNGSPFIDFESLKELFEFLKFFLMPQIFLINSSGWGMARAMHNVI